MLDVVRDPDGTSAPSTRGDVAPAQSAPGTVRAAQYLFALGAAAAAVVLWWLLTLVIQDDHSFLLPLVAVIAAAWVGGCWPAVVALACSLVALGVLRPRHEPGPISRHPIGAILFTTGGIGCALLGEAHRRARGRAEHSAAELERMVRDRTVELLRTNQALRDEAVEHDRARERERANLADLRQSNEELEKFAYVASHDLQEPLRKIQAFGDRLAKKCGEAVGEQGREYLDRILASATRMRRLIDDLLTYSRVSTRGQGMTSVDLNATLQAVLADLDWRLSQSGGQVEAGPLPTVWADPTQMRQLLQNLLANSLKFTREGVPPRIVVLAEKRGELGWRLILTDNGIGFEPVYANRIFELFQRLHGRDEYEGTGLGLAICRKIVERHGGAIQAFGKPGEGATFVIDLPTHPSGKASAP